MVCDSFLNYSDQEAEFSWNGLQIYDYWVYHAWSYNHL